MNDKELLDKLDKVTEQGYLPGLGFDGGWRAWMLNDDNFMGTEKTNAYPTVREALEVLFSDHIKEIM